MKFGVHILVWLSFLTISFSCTSGAGDNTDDILAYIDAKKLSITDTLAGVLVCVVTEGSVEKPKIDSTKTVTFTVKGEYLDGVVFDIGSSDQATTINMGAILEGLRLGITRFGKGGSGTIIVPPNLGFGSNPPRGIRPNATLAFNIQLVDFK